MHPRAKVSPETCKFRRHGCPLAKSCQCQTHSINLHVRGVSDVARTAIRSNTCMDETDEAAGRGSEAEKPPGADLPSIARGATPGHERDTTRAMELRAASRLRADHLVRPTYPAASRPPYLPEQEGQVRGGGRPPGPEERPRLPLLAHRPPRDNPPTRPSRPPYSGV